MSFNRRERKKPTFKKMTIQLGELNTDKFETEDLMTVLSDITFNLININLTMKKSDLGLAGKGYTPIGFVNKFYSDEEGYGFFEVAIFEKFAHVVEDSEDDKLIVARVFTNKEGKITKIIGLDLM